MKASRGRFVVFLLLALMLLAVAVLAPALAPYDP